MPDPHSEPEKYSIGEMMERLKNAPSQKPEDGELVIRADGSEAIRVRKRKRRTNQPAKSEKKKPDSGSSVLKVVGLFGGLVLVSLGIGVAIVYANSAPFRNSITQNIEQASGANIKLTQFRMNPRTANAGGLQLEWPDGNVLKSLALTGLVAEVSPFSFFGLKMIGEEVVANSGTLSLQIPTASEVTRHSPHVDASSSIQFKRYRVPALNLILGDPAAPILQLLKSEASLNPSAISGRSQLSLYKGDVSMKHWPKLRLDRALVEFHGSETDIIQLRLIHDSAKKGALEFTGTIYPYESNRKSTLAVGLDSFDISGVVGPGIGGLISGEIDSRPAATSNFISFSPAENSALVLDAAFQRNSSSKLTLQGFPFFLALAKIFEDPWFERPTFDGDAIGVIHREDDQVSLRRIDFVSNSRMALEGEISMSANQGLSGELELGISTPLLASSMNARLQAMFGDERNGFQWLKLRIGGSAAAPTDNFKELFLAATPVQNADPQPGEGGVSTFEELTRPK